MADQKNTPIRSTPDERTDVPAVDIYETGDQLVLVMDIPGVSNPEINVDGNDLTIEARAEYDEPDTPPLGGGEFAPRSFRRTFSLPAGIDVTGIQAKARDGVLRVQLPKSDEAKVHKIKVESE